MTALPLKVYIGTQTGRQYLLAWTPANDLFSFYRVDLIDNIKVGDALARTREAERRIDQTDQLEKTDLEKSDLGEPDLEKNNLDKTNLEKRLNEFCSHVWGVTGNNHTRLTHIEMTVFAGPEEGHIVERLHREKRCGTVDQLDDTHWRFSADVYEAFEMLPWLRTFTGRITDLQCTDKQLTARFWKDFKDQAKMYSLESL